MQIFFELGRLRKPISGRLGPLRTITAAAFGLAFLGQSPAIRADSISGSLGTNAGAINVHPVTCPVGTYLLSSQVINTTESAPLLSAQTVKGKHATNTTDPTSGDASYSPAVLNVGGSGTYHVTATKSASGAADYTVQYLCRTLSDVLQAGLLSITPPIIREEAREGATTMHTLEIGQGCQTSSTNPDGTFKANPVIADSVIFPLTSATGARSDTGSQVALTEVLANASSPIGSISVIQDKSIFRSQDLKLDGNKNVIGFHGLRGQLKTNLTGRIPFVFAAPAFNPASCAKRLLIKVAVADICKPGNRLDVGRVNLWIPDTTSKFSDSSLIPGSDGTAHSGLPATLIINRTSALDAGCGAGYDVTVWPDDNQIDAYLPIPKYWQP
jgi:hypothetical protein